MTMIQVEVVLYATLAEYVPGSKPGVPSVMELEEGKTVQELLEMLGVPGNDAKLIFINGVIKDPDCVLGDRDRVGIFPPVAGG